MELPHLAPTANTYFKPWQVYPSNFIMYQRVQ